MKYLNDGYFTSDISYPDYSDINSVMKCRLSSEQYSLWKEAFDEAVPYAVASRRWYSWIKQTYYYVDLDLYSGVTMYVPRDNPSFLLFNSDFKKTEWYNATGWSLAGW